jgi:hypothetical protein
MGEDVSRFEMGEDVSRFEVALIARPKKNSPTVFRSGCVGDTLVR